VVGCGWLVVCGVCVVCGVLWCAPLLRRIRTRRAKQFHLLLLIHGIAEVSILDTVLKDRIALTVTMSSESPTGDHTSGSGSGAEEEENDSGVIMTNRAHSGSGLLNGPGGSDQVDEETGQSSKMTKRKAKKIITAPHFVNRVWDSYSTSTR
jgi:hypothetical protein